MDLLHFTQKIRTKASKGAVWKSLTDPELVARYHVARLQTLDPRVGGKLIYGEAGRAMITGTIIEWRPEEKLSHTFRFDPLAHPGTGKDEETLVTYLIREEGKTAILSLTHSGFEVDNQTRANITAGWPVILSRLESCLQEEYCRHLSRITGKTA